MDCDCYHRGELVAWGVFLYASRSEPYQFSEHWLRDSPEVREKIGEVERTRLSFTGVFSDQFKGDLRRARVSTYVQGSRGSLIAHLHLQKRGADDWLVVRCRLELQ
jgi:hypothetical protein